MTSLNVLKKGEAACFINLFETRQSLKHESYICMDRGSTFTEIPHAGLAAYACQFKIRIEKISQVAMDIEGKILRARRKRHPRDCQGIKAASEIGHDADRPEMPKQACIKVIDVGQSLTGRRMPCQ